MRTLVVIAACTAAVFLAPPAQAAPNGCQDVASHRNYTVSCGARFPLNYQAWADCKDDMFPWNEHHVTGNWAHPSDPPGASQARCGAWAWVQRSGMSTR